MYCSKVFVLRCYVNYVNEVGAMTKKDRIADFLDRILQKKLGTETDYAQLISEHLDPGCKMLDYGVATGRLDEQSGTLYRDFLVLWIHSKEAEGYTFRLTDEELLVEAPVGLTSLIAQTDRQWLSWFGFHCRAKRDKDRQCSVWYLRGSDDEKPRGNFHMTERCRYCGSHMIRKLQFIKSRSGTKFEFLHQVLECPKCKNTIMDLSRKMPRPRENSETQKAEESRAQTNTETERCDACGSPMFRTGRFMPIGGEEILECPKCGNTSFVGEWHVREAPRKIA